MKKESIDRMIYLQANYFIEWKKSFQEAENELSSEQTIKCVCGRLATGMHELNCSKFKNKVNNYTLKKLKHLN